MEKLRKRIVVTGMYDITPFGGSEAMMASIYARKSAITPLPQEYNHCPTRIGGIIPDFDLASWIDAKEVFRTIRRGSRPSQLVGATAYKALRQARLLGDDGKLLASQRERTGVAIGTDFGDIKLISDMAVRMHLLEQAVASEEKTRILRETVTAHFLSAYQALPDAETYLSAMGLGAEGPSSTLVKACATGPGNIRLAAMEIDIGAADIMVAGAVTQLTPQAVMIFNMLGTRNPNQIQGALSRRNDEPQRASRPFDQHHDGFVPSEGATVMVIESLESALKRDVTPLAELTGFGSTTDARSPTDPHPAIQERAIWQALEMAGKKPEDIDLLKDHCTGTLIGDIVAAKVIKAVWGNRRIPIIVPKCWLGHQLANAGTVEASVAIRVMNFGVIPPAINWEDPIAETLLCEESHHHTFPYCYFNIPLQPTRAKIKTVVCTSAGFGGQNAPLVLEKFEG